jgi:hypothetical protein
MCVENFSEKELRFLELLFEELEDYVDTLCDYPLQDVFYKLFEQIGVPKE